MMNGPEEETTVVYICETDDEASQVLIQETKNIWSYEETIALINIYAAHKEEFLQSSNRKEVWERINGELLKSGITYNVNKCENKWKNLLRTYKVVRDSMNKTGKGPQRFKFFNEIDQVVGDYPKIELDIKQEGFISQSTDFKYDFNKSEFKYRKPKYEADTWSHNDTLIFFDVYENRKRELENSNNKKETWEIISIELANLGVYHTPDKCEAKWRNLLRTYRAIKESINTTGKGPTKFLYFENIQQILGETVCNSTANDEIESEPNSDNEDEENKVGSTETGKKRKMDELIELKIDYFKHKKQMREKQEKHRQEKLKIQNRVLELEERKLLLLEKYINLNKKR